MSLMELFGGKKKEDEEEYTHQEEEPEQRPEFNMVKAISGMSEKQLLRFLVIMEYEKSSEELTETWSELINISKEEA